MKQFNGKAIYNPKGKAGEYAEWACNFYVGCSNGCTYCYLKKGVLSKALGGDVPTLKKCFKSEEHALEVFEKELLQNKAELQKHGLFFSFTTDPLLSECNNLTWEATMLAMECSIPVKILTKVASKAFITLVEEMHDSWKPYLAIGFTLTGHDELEPNASSNNDRIICMKALHKAGFKTFASIEPIIDFESALKMIEQTVGFCDLYKVGLMSGGKYNEGDLLSFVRAVTLLLQDHSAKVYWKDSIRKHLDFLDYEKYPSVNRDYNMFNN